MGHQIIRQPNGKLCVFSSIVDEIIISGATPADLIAYYREEAATRAEAEVTKIIAALNVGHPERVYARPFVMTYEEAARIHRSKGGDPDMLYG